MPIKVLEYTQTSIYNYLDDVLNYYKTANDASFGEWPDNEIGWRSYERKQRFYRYVSEWFAERDVNIINHNNSNRYLSTFIVAAEFPPTLGYKGLIEQIVGRYGWRSLYREPKEFLDLYIDSIIITDYTVAQQQSLITESDGYWAFLELLTILSSIRYLLGTSDNLEEICVRVASEYERDIELVQRVALAYEEVLIPPQKGLHIDPVPQFSFELIRQDIWKLVISHNLNVRTQIQLPSSVELSRLSIATLTGIAGEEILLSVSSQPVELEAIDYQTTLDCGYKLNYFPVIKRNVGLKDVRFFLTIPNKSADLSSITIGEIHRQDDFLVFDTQGNEIVSKSRMYKRGQSLLIVPLNTQVGKSLDQSPYFEQLRYPESLPIFELKGIHEEVDIDGKTLFFSAVPFQIHLRSQTPWEKLFSRSERLPSYFFSPMMNITLEGDFTGIPAPQVQLSKIEKRRGERTSQIIETIYVNNQIRPLTNFPSPGTYSLIVKFAGEKQKSLRFRLIPIRRIQLLDEKHIRLKLYAEADSFKLIGEQPCSVVIGSKKDVVDLKFQQYGIHEIVAIYTYKIGNQRIKMPLRFLFQAQQEVVGHFSRELVGNNTAFLSITEDLIPNSYLEFRKNSLRDTNQQYTISAYMEGEVQQGLYPRQQRFNVDGNEKLILTSLIQNVREYAYSRLTIIVDCSGVELFRATFTDSLVNIINLYDEWQKGCYSELLAIPIYSLEPSTVTDILSIPDNSIVYGMVDDTDGKTRYATHGTINLSIMPKGRTLVEKFLDFFIAEISLENPNDVLMSILTSPKDACEFIKWYTKASKLDYPYDLPPIVYLMDKYPIIAVWAELARDPKNRDGLFTHITDEAKFFAATDKYYIPNGANLASHPRYSPELMTVNDVKVLEDLHLLPSHDEGAQTLLKLGMFCTFPFVVGSKPILSWLTLFWFHSYCVKNHLVETFTQIEGHIIYDNPLSVLNVSSEFTKEMPSYSVDKSREQDIKKIFESEQVYYLQPMVNSIPGLLNFFSQLDSYSFSAGLAHIIGEKPLMYAEPDIKGFQNSTKWKFILFLSLTVVCTQLDQKIYLERLKELWNFTSEQYTYLIKWVNHNKETSKIYDAYYEYWMMLFWREKRV